MKNLFVLMAVATLLAACASNMNTRSSTLKYPVTKKVDLVENLHGTPVPDPYRWLEDDNSAETAAWVEARTFVTSV
jgi:prolyl oligopeptidase